MDISRKTAWIVGTLFLIILLSSGLAIAVPQLINYQGKLVDSVGDPVNTDVNITFTIYNAPTGGSPLWTETQTVSIVNGIFNVYLGSQTPIPADTFGADEVYLGIQVEGNAEMTPRQQYSAAPFAFRSHTADLVADGAVTSAMITNGTIIGTDIAADSITSNEIATGAVTTGEIADGTITDADIDASASISASKINSTDLDADTLDGLDSTNFFDRATFDLNSDGVMDSANNADTLDGMDSAIFSRKYAKVAVVAINGGDYTSPVDAVTDLGTWCGTPPLTDPCLIKVMPGIYEVGASPVVLQPFLSIEGSGINSTLINGTIDGTTSGVIVGAGISEIKHLSVQNSGGGVYAVAIYNNYNAANDNFRIYDVHAMAEGATRCYTIFNDNDASAEIRTVTAFANCTGQNIAIFSDTGSEITIENTNIDVSDGSSDAYGIEFFSTSSSFMSNVRIKASSNGTTTVSGVYYFSSTGEMHNVIAEASGGIPKGVLIEQNSDVTMRNVTVKASEPASGKDTSGINISLSNVDMEGVSIEAANSGSTDYVRGIYADVSTSGEVSMKGLRITATGGNDCYGIHAINNPNGYIPMTDVQVWSFCEVARGIFAYGGDFGMKNLEAVGSGGSGVGGSGTGISLYDAYAGMQGVEALGNGGYSTNYGIYSNISDIEGVNVRAQGESFNSTSENYGLYVTDTGSSASITGGQIKSYSGMKGYGVYLNNSSTVELNGVKIQANSASDSAYGIFLNTGSVELSGVEVRAANATSTYGINGAGSGGSITLRNSVIEGADYTVTAISGYFFSAASSGFIGPVPAGGMSIQCVNSHQESGGVLNGLGTGCTVP